jgi:pilus assembly protein CpaC
MVIAFRPYRRSQTLLISVSMAFLASARLVGAQEPRPADVVRADVQNMPRVVLTSGRSTIVETAFDITRIAVTNPAVADAVVVRPREILVDGKGPGTVSLIVWGGSGRSHYDVVVEPPVAALEQQLQQLFPNDRIQVMVSADAVVLSGQVSSTQTMLRAAEVARATTPKVNVINMLQVPGASDSQQVMLQVRFAEVDRRALMEVGASFFTGIAGAHGWTGRTTTQQFATPSFDYQEGGLVFSDFLNLFLFNSKENIGGVIRALKQSGSFQSLAEPNLIAYNGKEASFLAGGEFPVPIVQGGGLGGAAVSISYKEFGVRLNFTPTIAGDLIRLHVRPEVSTLDFSNGVLMDGFRIPALSTRRAETEVELRDGQSFAIAGLINNQAQLDKTAIPILGSLPIIGHLFKSKADRKERTELLVIVTPRLVRPLNPDEVPPLPTMPGRFLPSGDDIGEHLQGGGGTIDAPSEVAATSRTSGKR